MTAYTVMTTSIEQVEAFKSGQDPANALHSKFGLRTGEPVLSLKEYNHLQIDVVSLFLLVIVQTVSSGLKIIYCPDEVAFVQNLVSCKICLISPCTASTALLALIEVRRLLRHILGAAVQILQ